MLRAALSSGIVVGVGMSIVIGTVAVTGAGMATAALGTLMPLVRIGAPSRSALSRIC